MNSNKFNFYKNSVYFLIANAVVAVIALVIGIVFGVNYNTSVLPGNLLFNTVMSVLLSLVAIFLFVGFTTSFAKAFSVVLIATNNVLLSTSIIVLVRIQVSESIVMGYILLVAITTLFTLLATQKFENINFKKEDKNQIIKKSLRENSKVVLFTSISFVAVLLLGLIVASASMFDLVREFLVMLAVIVYGYLTIQLPIVCYMSTKIKTRKKVKVDKKVENQKLVKAVSTDTEEQDGVIEQNNEEDNQEMID